MWKALNRGDSVQKESVDASTRPTPLVDAEPMLVDPEEIPFIEVGPQKSVEASPSVLACSPTNRPTASTTISAASRAGSTETLPKPKNVPFRTVFLATPEMESETPQTDALSRLISFL
jgi:hypothetical protein